MSSWREYFCKILGCQVDCSEYEAALREAHAIRVDLESKLIKAHEKNRQLELLVLRPTPPKIEYVERDTAWVQQHLEGLGLNIIRLPLDVKYRFPATKKEAMKIISWDWTDTLTYIRDHFDCPDFAMHFMVQTNLFFRIQTCWVIDYMSRHSYNIIIIPGVTDFILEPQSDALYMWTKRPEQFYYLKGSYVAL